MNYSKKEVCRKMKNKVRDLQKRNVEGKQTKAALIFGGIRHYYPSSSNNDLQQLYDKCFFFVLLKNDDFVCQFATKIEEISNYCIILLSLIIAASLSQSLQLFVFFSIWFDVNSLNY